MYLSWYMTYKIAQIKKCQIPPVVNHSIGLDYSGFGMNEIDSWIFLEIYFCKNKCYIFLFRFTLYCGQYNLKIMCIDILGVLVVSYSAIDMPEVFQADHPFILVLQARNGDKTNIIFLGKVAVPKWASWIDFQNLLLLY